MYLIVRFVRQRWFLWTFLSLLALPKTGLSQCPRVEAIFVDACGTEQINEFIIIHSGSAGFNTNNIVVDFPIGNNNMSVQNNDINTNVDNWPPGTPCGLATGNPAAFTGCSNIIVIGPGFQVPPNQIVILQMSSGNSNGIYNFSSLCGSGQCVYVIANGCTRTIGGFSNNSSSGTRTTNFEYGGGCTESITYDTALLPAGNGDYYLPITDTYGNAGCVVPPTSPAPSPSTPVFDIDDEYCVGETPDNLPTTSDNGVTGTWNPTSISTASPGSTNYVFTPAVGQCATPFTLTVVVTANVNPIFSFILDYCQNDTPDVLPGTSNNGITGTWSPPVINTSTPGSFDFDFTPDPNQCGLPITMTVTIFPLETPDFSIEDEYCVGDTPDNLPTTSNNGISGSWSPATINTSAPGTTIYTFTPGANECATDFELSVTVTANVTPIFTIDNTYCVGDTPDNLPNTSNNGVDGTWNPATINTSSPGTTTYTYTPDAGQCAVNVNLTVTVNANVTPTFPPIGDVCEGGTAPPLPMTSLNGITGTWNPAVINTSTPGTFSFTFTPDAGQCASPVTITVNVLESPRGFISGNVNICPGQCGEVSFNLSGGSGVYTINLQISVGPFTIPFTVPGASISTTLEICYTGTGFLPSFQPPATLIIPQSAPPGTATLTLLSIADGNGGPCPNGIIGSNMMSVTLRSRPTANNAQLTVCDEDNDGIGIFDLTDAEETVTGNNPNLTVSWYSDSGFNNPINNPTMFSAPGGTVVYAVVEDQFGCTDDAEVTLLIEMPETPDLPSFTVCVTDPPFNLPTTVDGVTGNWSDANGHVTNNQFDPAGLAEGDYIITFTPDPGQCFISETTTVTVTSGGPIPLDGIPSVVCVGIGTLPLPEMPNGVIGIWSSPSPHLNGNVFNVAAAGPGFYDFTFTPDDPNSCFLPNTIQVEVVANAILTPPIFPDICENTGPYSLGSTINGVSGTWGNSPHVTNNQFNTNAGDGTYSITFFPDDDCTNDLEVMIEIDPATNLNPVVFSNLCNSSPPIDLPLLVQGFAGIWTLNNVIITQFNPQTSGNGTFSLVFTPIPGSCANGFTSTINVGSVYAGEDRNENYCLDQNNILNLTIYLSPAAGSGGIWFVNGNPLSNPTMYDMNSLPDGTHVFWYVLNDMTCGNDTSFLDFSVQRARVAGNDGSISLCQSNLAGVNFSSILATFSAGGTWTNNRNIVMDYSNPSSVNLDNLPVGQTIFQHRFDAGVCPGDTAMILVSIDSFFQAGSDNSGDVCINSMTNLNTLVSSTYQGGTFLDVNGYGGLSGSIWDASGKPIGVYTFAYANGPNGVCPGDTANLTLSVQANITAGGDVTGEYCDGAGFVPSDFLPATASPGGKIFNGGFEVPFGMLVLGNLQKYQFLYVTGDGNTCPFDTATWTINRVNRPNLNFIINTVSICEGECADLVIRHNSNTSREIGVGLINMNTFSGTYTLVPGQDLLINICNDDSKPYSLVNIPINPLNLFYINSIQEGQCTFTFPISPSANINVRPMPVANFNRTLCKGRFITIGSKRFDEINPSGSVIVPGVGVQCDTMYNVSLTFRPEALANFTQNTCDPNFSITIGNLTFNQANPSGMVTLANASFFGCDSIVNVTLNFLTPGRNIINETTCDPAYVLTFGNTSFNKDKPSGQVVLFGQATNGCDSIISVNLRFLSPSSATIDTTLCDPGFSLKVGNTTFNANNPSGQITLAGGSVNGCDSLVTVNLNFENFIVGNEVIVPLCGQNQGSVIFKESNEAGPFQFFVNGQQEPDIPSMPFEKQLSPGSYQFLIISEDGCSRTFIAEIPDNSLPLVTLDSVNTGNDVYRFTLTGETSKISGISWSPSGIFSCSDCTNTVANPTENTVVTLEYTYGTGCSEQIQFLIKKAVVGDFILPNAIKLGSGVNGTFFIQAPSSFSGIISKISIYDRWGDKVYYKENIPLGDAGVGWDGFFLGREVQPGVYVFVAEVMKTTNGEIIFLQGDITVIR